MLQPRQNNSSIAIEFGWEQRTTERKAKIAMRSYASHNAYKQKENTTLYNKSTAEEIASSLGGSTAWRKTR